MVIIGVSGGIGSGKSTLLDYIGQKNGVYTIRLDDAGKMMQRPGTDCFRKITELFGENILTPDKEIDRAVLSAIVFADKKKRKKLEEIIHPAVLDFVKEDIETRRREGARFYVMESAVLYTSGFASMCDFVVHMCAKESVRMKRLLSSRGEDEKKWYGVMEAQQKEEVQRLRMMGQGLRVFVIENTGAPEEMKKQADHVFERLAVRRTK